MLSVSEFRYRSRYLLSNIRRIIRRVRYNSSEMADYFRRQGAQIGEGCRLDVAFLGGIPSLVNLGNHVFISQGVIFHTHDGGVWLLREEIPNIDIFGKIVVEDNCVIGANTQLLPGIRIGRNSIIGAGSVVISDIPPNSVAMGVPARVVGSTIKYREKCLAMWKDQKPPDNLPKDLLKREKAVEKHILQYFKDHPD